MKAVGLVLGIAIASAGCGNACQQICGRMAAYARDCGYDVPNDEVQACMAEQADATDRDVCREFGSRETIREQWTCDDVAAYFERANANDSGSSDTGRVE
jgi:hypothetical protein